MRYRRLGLSDLQVSEIALGSWLTYGTAVPRDVALACVDRALGLGVNLLDTANVYGGGAAETFLAEALAGRPRDAYVLATKLFFPMSPVDRGLSAQQVRRQLDASLQRLRVEYVDLYLCHRYDRHTPLEDTMRALGDAVRAGKVRWLGLSEWSPVEIRAADDIARQEGLPPFVCSQPQYSPLWRDIEAEVIPTCETRGIGQVVCSPLAQGVLTGKYRAGAPPPADSRAASPESGMFLAQEGPLRNDEVLLAVEGLRPVAADLGVTMAQLALAWVLRQSNVASALTGATRPEQVEENVAASGVLLDAEALRRIDEAVGRVAHRAGDERRMRPR